MFALFTSRDISRLDLISYNSPLLYAKKSEALIALERERVCWLVQKFFNNENTRSAAAEEGWTRTTKGDASHHILNRSAHLQSLEKKVDLQYLQFPSILSLSSSIHLVEVYRKTFWR